MELSVIENDHLEVKKYLENFVPDNYYRVLGDAYLYQVRAVLQHAVRNAGEYNVRYDSLINSLTAQFEQNRVNIGQEISAWGNKHTVHAQRLTYLEAENNTVSASITELEKIIISNNKAILEKTNKLAAQLVDFEVGGVNLIHNSTFAKGYKAVGDVAITTSDHVLGTLFKIVNLADVEEEIGIGSLVEFNKIKLMEGKQYTLSFYGFGSVELINSIKLNKGDLVHTLDPIIMDSDISNRKTLTFIAPFSGDDIGFSIGTVGYPEDSWFSLVAVQLELGSRATDWSPSPFDNADYIARVAASLEEVRKITIEQQKVNVAAIDTLRANIGETKGQISNEREINLTKFSSMTRQLDELTSTTAGNTSRITNLDNTYTDKFTANAEKLVELEANIGASNAAITRVDEVVSTNTSAIATSTNNLSAKIDGIKIGGRNLIRNSTFKLGHEAWGDATITRKDTVLGSEVTITNKGSAQFGIQNDVLFRSISLVEGDEYTLSFYGNGNIPSINSIWLKSEGNDPQLLSEIAIDAVLAEKKVLTFTSTITADNVSIIIAAAGYPKGSWFKIVALQLEKGNKATDWTEAPEDIVNFISGVEANINEFKEVQVGINGATATQLNTLNTKTANSSAAIDELRETTSNIEGSTATLETKLRGEYTSAVSTAKSDITKATDGKIDAVKTTLRDMTTDISSKADISRVDSVENNAKQSLATAKTDLTSSYTSAISTARTESATDATNKANKAKTDANTYTDGKVTTLTTLVNSKANISRVDEVENNANKALASTKSELTTEYTKSISKAIENIEVGGRNLLENSNFDSSKGKWTNNNAATFEYIADSVGRITLTAAQSTPGLKYINNIGLEEGYYTLSVRADVRNMPVDLLLYHGSQLGGGANGLPIVFGDVDDQGFSIGTVTYYTKKVEPRIFYILVIASNPLVSVGDYFDIDWIKLEKGNKATDWTPAPEDVTGYIDSEIDKVTTKIESKADISRVDSIESNAIQSIAQAKTDLTSSYTSAISTVKSQSATDAQNKANKALADANSVTATKASEAQEAAEAYALAKAKAEADAALALAKGDATSKSDAAKSAAIAAAALDAKNKADKALADAKLDATAKAEAAKKYAKDLVDTLTTVVNSKADITRVDKVVNDSTQALAQAKTDITGAYTLAITESSELSAADAKAKADKALADATIKATAAQTAAETYALAQANAKAAAALDSAKSDATTKANKAKADAELAAALDAKNKADEALRLAKLDATTKANAVKDMVVALTKVVDSKASISRVDTIENNANQALATAKTELTSSFKSSIDSIEIGGRNLAINTGTGLWVTYGSGVVITNSTGSDGNNITKVVQTTTATGGIQQSVSDRTMSLEANGKYIISFDVRSNIVSSSALLNYLYIMHTVGGNQSVNVSEFALSPTRFTRVSASFTKTGTSPTSYIMISSLSNTVNDWFEVKNVKVEKGNKATDWSPAPEDTTEYVDKGLANAKTTSEQYAAQKAAEAKSAAETYALAKAKAEADAALVLAKSDATTKSNAAKSAAEANAALDAKNKADKALADAKLDATAKANKALADAKTDSANKVAALKTTVDSKATITQLNTVKNDANQALATAKTDLTGSYTKAIEDIEVGGRNYIVSSRAGSFRGSATVLGKSAAYSIVDNIIDIKSHPNDLVGFVVFLQGNEGKMKLSLISGATSIATYYTFQGSPRQNTTLKKTGNLFELDLVVPVGCTKLDIGVSQFPYSVPHQLINLKLEKGNKITDWTPAPEDVTNYVDTSVSTLKTLVDSKASISRVDTVENDAKKALATAKTELTGSYTSAIATAKSQSATDAQTRATKALTDAKADTVLKANAAETAAKTYALAEAKAKADAALVTAKSDSTTKANAAESAAKLAAAADAKTKADKALADAKIDSKAKADTAERLAKAHADTKVTALTKIVDSKASISSVDTVENDAKKALAAAKTELTSSYTEAIDGIEIGGRNLIVLSASGVVESRYLNSSGGAVTSANWFVTDNIPVTSGTSYIVSGYRNLGSAPSTVFYGADGTYISGIGGSARRIVTAPANATTMKISLEKADKATIKLEKGNKVTDWTPAPEDIEASITSESKARSDADTALGNRITTLDTDYKGNKTAIRTELTAVSNKANSTANSLSTLTTTVGGNTTKISQESTARSTADTALGNRITATDAIAKNAQSRVGTAETAISTANSALATLRTDLTASYTVKDTRNTNETPAWYITNHPRQVVREFKSSSTIGISGGGYTYLETTVKYGDASGGNVTQEATSNTGIVYVRRGAGTTWQAWVQQEDTAGSAAKVEAARKVLDGKINTTDARVTAEKKVAADATSAVAKTVGTLTTTVNGHTSSINETKTSLNGISAKWTMETNVNGKVSGIYQHSTGKSSGLDIITDKFTLSNGTTAGYAPFRQEGSTTYLNMAVIKDASIATAKIANLAVSTAKIANLAVSTAKIANLAVKTAQIDNLAVTSGKIANLAVDTLHIAGNAVTIPQAVDGVHNEALGDTQSITAVTLALPTDKGVTSINFNTVLNFKITVQSASTSSTSTVKVYARIYENNTLIENDTLVWTQTVSRNTTGTSEVGTTVTLTRHINQGVAKNIRVDLYATYDRLVRQSTLVTLTVLHTKLQAMTVRR